MEMSVIVDGIRPEARPTVLLEKLTEASALVARSGLKDPPKQQNGQLAVRNILGCPELDASRGFHLVSVYIWFGMAPWLFGAGGNHEPRR